MKTAGTIDGSKSFLKAYIALFLFTVSFSNSIIVQNEYYIALVQYNNITCAL